MPSEGKNPGYRPVLKCGLKDLWLSPGLEASMNHREKSSCTGKRGLPAQSPDKGQGQGNGTKIVSSHGRSEFLSLEEVSS